MKNPLTKKGGGTKRRGANSVSGDRNFQHSGAEREKVGKEEKKREGAAGIHKEAKGQADNNSFIRRYREEFLCRGGPIHKGR